MIALPPESSGARLLKFRRMRNREIDFRVEGDDRGGISLRAVSSVGRSLNKERDVISIAIRITLHRTNSTAKRNKKRCLHETSIDRICSSTKKGGALASTRRWKRGRHVEDGSLASLKTGPKQINADHEDLALAA